MKGLYVTSVETQQTEIKAVVALKLHLKVMMAAENAKEKITFMLNI